MTLAMPGPMHRIRPAEVNDPVIFGMYVSEQLGTPTPRNRDVPVLRKHVQTFFDTNPQATWATLIETVAWCKAKRKRLRYPWSVCSMVRLAWADGVLPELDPKPRVDWNVADQIERALQVETDPSWRRMLAGAMTPDVQRRVLTHWRQSRREALA